MASKTILRTVSGVPDVRVALTNSSLVRQLSVGGTWQHIRVAIRFSLLDSGANITSSPDFALGVCSGSALPYNNGSANTTHFVGIRNATAATWLYQSFIPTNPPHWLPAGAYHIKACKRVGTTFTYTAGVNNMLYVWPWIASEVHRQVFSVDIVKGAPDFQIRPFAKLSTTPAADISKTQFLDQMGLMSPLIADHGFGAYNTVAVNEGVDGVLDHVNIAWDRVVPSVEVSDLIIVRFA